MPEKTLLNGQIKVSVFFLLLQYFHEVKIFKYIPKSKVEYLHYKLMIALFHVTRPKDKEIVWILTCVINRIN